MLRQILNYLNQNKQVIVIYLVCHVKVINVTNVGNLLFGIFGVVIVQFSFDICFNLIIAFIINILVTIAFIEILNYVVMCIQFVDFVINFHV